MKHTCLFAPMGALLLFGTIVGCGQSGSKLPPLVPVRGRVLVGSAPFTNGQVTLVPTVTNGRMTTGKIDDTGNYEVFTDGKPGAPLGEYTAVVTPAMMPAGTTDAPANPTFNPRFMDMRQSPLKIVVEESPKQYDLTLTK